MEICLLEVLIRTCLKEKVTYFGPIVDRLLECGFKTKRMGSISIIMLKDKNKNESIKMDD